MFRAQQNSFDEVVGECSVTFGTSNGCSVFVYLVWMYLLTRSSFLGDIGKATDENLTSENWEYIMVCFMSFSASEELID